MALRLLSSQDGGAGEVPLSATGRHLALGGERSAPRHLASGFRWVGGKPAEIDAGFIAKCTEGTEAGRVTDLNFHFKFLEQIQGLESHAATLRTLDLSSNNIRHVEGLQGMGKLRELKLYGCQIGRIQGLEHCVSLVALHLEDNQISAIEGLDHHRLLEYLNLDKNRITKVGRGLAKLTKLRELHLSQNQLRAVDGLNSLGSLEVLTLSHNELREITSEQLKGLGRLDELRLADNQLSSLSFLAAGGATGGGAAAASLPPLPCLATLDVSGNLLTSEALKGLPMLPQVVELSLAGNHIEELSALAVANIPSLEILDLARNRIESPDELLKLKELISLRELLLEGNPLTADREGLSTALAALESLEYLDDKPVPLRPPTPAPRVGDDGEDVPTFVLTTTKALRENPGALGDTMTGGSRPSTASRPGTAQNLKEAGVKDPLMHLRLKLSDRRFASEEQATLWEKQTLASLAAIEAQIEKTVKQAEGELQDMDRYLQKAQKVMRKQAELRSKGVLPSAVPPVPEDDSDDDRRGDSQSSPHNRASFAGRRLRAAMGASQGEDHYMARSRSSSPESLA